MRFWRAIAKSVVNRSGRECDDSLCLPRYGFDQIIPNAELIPVTVIDYEYIYGGIPILELVMLCKIVRYRQPKIAFEIGTFFGETTLQLASNSEAEVYTLDLPPPGHKNYVLPEVVDPELDVYPSQAGVRFRSTQYADRIHQLFGNSKSYDFTRWYGKVDLVLVDGCHHYEFVLRDSHNALKMMSPNGVVIWHDYASYAPGVVQALNEVGEIAQLVHIAETSLVIHHRGS